MIISKTVTYGKIIAFLRKVCVASLRISLALGVTVVLLVATENMLVSRCVKIWCDGEWMVIAPFMLLAAGLAFVMLRRAVSAPLYYLAGLVIGTKCTS